MTAPRPIEIVGGGLAGLSLGCALRRAGVPVTIFETGDYPRHRVCGEFITGLAPNTVTRLGLANALDGALHHHDVAWFLAGGQTPARVQRLPSPALGISRYTLDARLAAIFTRAGGQLHSGTRITDLAPGPGRVLANGRRRGRSRWLGLKIHVHSLDLVRDLELHLGDHAYVGLARVESGAVNVCGLFRRRDLCGKGANLLLSYLQSAGLASLAARLAAAKLDSDSFCAVAALSFDGRVSDDGRLCLGDACAMIPPFTGNGMAMAFQSADVALDPLLAYARNALPWSDACRAIHAALCHRFCLRLTSAKALHPLFIHPLGQRLLAALNRTHLLPLQPLFAALH